MTGGGEFAPATRKTTILCTIVYYLPHALPRDVQSTKRSNAHKFPVPMQWTPRKYTMSRQTLGMHFIILGCFFCAHQTSAFVAQPLPPTASSRISRQQQQQLIPNFRKPESAVRRHRLAPKTISTITTPPRTTPLLLLQMSTRAATTKTVGRKRLATAMAFLTGWADVCFYVNFKAFGSMLTGNTMQLGIAVAAGHYRQVAFSASVILSYLAGTAVFRRTDVSLRKKTLPVCGILVAILFGLGDWIHYFQGGARWIPMMLFAGAFGVTNSLGTEVSGTLTFVVTGHLTRLVNQGVDRWSRTAGRTKLTEAQTTAAVQNAAICGGFVAGAAFAATLLRRGLLERFGVFSVIGVLHAILWLAHDIEAIGGAWWLRENKDLCDLDDDGKLCEEEDNVADLGDNLVIENTQTSSEEYDPEALRP